MTTPTVTERDDFADEAPRKRHGENAEQAERGSRQPRHRPYHRPSQAELVRQSVDAYTMHTHAYDGETR
jgi:hypothetical protein